MLRHLIPSSWSKRGVRWLEENRGLVVLFFCLPASFIFNILLRVVGWVRKTAADPKLHASRVQHIQDQVKSWIRNGKKGLLCTARPNWLSLSVTFFKKEECHKVDVPLYAILALDEKNLTVTVEPMVTVSQITSYLVPKGFTLAVTLEIGDATLGGLAMGTGMTTHSHKVGLYQEGILAYEVVLADGSCVWATRDNEYKDLFAALPWSHGSLGFLVGLKLQLIRAKPYVNLTYIPIKGKKKYCDAIREASGANHKDTKVADFVEATIYSEEEAVLMLGNFSDGKEGKVNAVSRWWKPWFYEHTRSFLDKGESSELIPLRDYLLRHDRAIFWVVEAMIPFGNNPLFRACFGWLLPPKPAFLKFTTTAGIRAMTFTKQVFQDIVLPLSHLEEQIDTSTTLFDTFPLLVYPCRIYDRGEKAGQLRAPKNLVPGTNYALFNDLGIYGVPGPVKRKERFQAVDAMRKMEKFTRDVGGYAFLYADIFMNEEEFRQMFDLSLYEEVRKKYHAVGGFPHLFDKVKPEIDVFEIGEAYADPF